MKCRVEIISILKNERSWSIKDFIKYFNISEKELFDTFLEILKQEVNQLDFDLDLDRYKYLYKVFKYFDNLDSSLIENVTKKLNKIKGICNSRIDRAIKEGNQNAIFNNVFYKIIDIIDVTTLKLEFNKSTDSDISINEMERNYTFLYELIYNVKNYDYVYEIFKTLPKLMYTISPKGEPLIEELLNHYIKLVKENSDLFDIIYFEKIIKLFLNLKTFSLNKGYQQELINKLFNIISDLKREKMKKREIERIKFFINEIIKDLKNNNENAIKDINFKYNIAPDFDEDVLEESRNAIAIDNTKYIDLTRKYVVTIDSPDTRMYDDACSFEKLKNGNYLLGIYVADADAFIKQDTLLDAVAYNRSESIYLPSNKIVMLPSELTHRISLYEKVPRFAVGYFFLFDSNMNFLSFNVRRTIINVKRNLDYFDVEKALNKSNDKELFNLIKDMIMAVELLKEKQIYNEQYETVKKIKRIIIPTDDANSNKYEEHKERIIFSTFIVLMNHYIGRFFDEHKDIPFPYHVNLSRYDDYVIKDLKQKIYSNADFETILECLNEIYIPSFYTTENLGHNGLNLMSYASASNPLRQYASLITERLVKHHMIDKREDLLFDLEKMKEICDHINSRQQINFEYKKEYMKLKQRKRS